MFRETLLESTPSRRQRKRWPMAVAFTAEVVVAALLVAVPLLSTGVISVSANPPRVMPLGRPDLGQPPHPPAGGRTSPVRRFVVPIVTTCCNRLPDRRAFARAGDGPGDDSLPDLRVPGGGFPNLPFSGPAVPPTLQPPSKRIRISVISEGQLITRVEPVYPHIAVITGAQGEVRLHAIIAKDGSIQSLSVTNAASPLLAKAALDAVRQWRYKPYYLNGEPVEVETFINVNFKKTNE